MKSLGIKNEMPEDNLGSPTAIPGRMSAPTKPAGGPKMRFPTAHIGHEHPGMTKLAKGQQVMMKGIVHSHEASMSPKEGHSKIHITHMAPMGAAPQTSDDFRDAFGAAENNEDGTEGGSEDNQD